MNWIEFLGNFPDFGTLSLIYQRIKRIYERPWSSNEFFGAQKLCFYVSDTLDFGSMPNFLAKVCRYLKYFYKDAWKILISVVRSGSHKYFIAN